MDSPVISRVRLPDVYGAPQDSPLLDWPSVEQRLSEAKRYWISTAGAGRAPISRPVDGNWIRGALYFGGDPKARWQRNLAANPQACVTLENAESPIILEGSVETLLPDEKLAEILAKSAQAKYGWDQSSGSFRTAPQPSPSASPVARPGSSTMEQPLPVADAPWKRLFHARPARFGPTR